MNKLESLVPHLVLCKMLAKKLPDLFDDTALFLVEQHGSFEVMTRRALNLWLFSSKSWKDCANTFIYPAPTFTELLDKLPDTLERNGEKFELYFSRTVSTYFIGYRKDNDETYLLANETSKNPVTAALRLLLKIHENKDDEK